MSSQSPPGERLTVTKSAVPNNEATPGIASTAAANEFPAASSAEEKLSVSVSATSSANRIAFGLGVGEGSAEATSRAYSGAGLGRIEGVTDPRVADHLVGVELQIVELVERRERALIQHQPEEAARYQREIDALQTELASTADSAAIY